MIASFGMEGKWRLCNSLVTDCTAQTLPDTMEALFSFRRYSATSLKLAPEPAVLNGCEKVLKVY